MASNSKDENHDTPSSDDDRSVPPPLGSRCDENDNSLVLKKQRISSSSAPTAPHEGGNNFYGVFSRNAASISCLHIFHEDPFASYSMAFCDF